MRCVSAYNLTLLTIYSNTSSPIINLFPYHFCKYSLYMNVAKICTINANQVGNFEATPGQQSDKMSHGKNKQSRLVEMQLH